MAKKKKAKAKKKVSKKRKTTKRKKAAAKGPHPKRGLHAKKAEIMAAVPNMPCSAISRDPAGLRFAHTRAERVYATYRDLCAERGLVIRRIEGITEDAHYGEFVYAEDRNEPAKIVKRPCVRFQGLWEIRDRATGQTETFGGAGDGDNGVWSANSAQTVARKQALLDYFETAWPQPTDYLKVIRDSIAAVPDAEKVEAFKQILPEHAWNVMTQTGAVKALTDLFEGKPKNGNTNSRTRKTGRSKS
jgi:hypothetical protein